MNKSLAAFFFLFLPVLFFCCQTDQKTNDKRTQGKSIATVNSPEKNLTAGIEFAKQIIYLDTSVSQRDYILDLLNNCIIGKIEIPAGATNMPEAYFAKLKNSDVLFFLTDSVSMIRVGGSRADLVFNPYFVNGRRVVFVRTSEVVTMKTKSLACQLIHELIHVRQFLLYPEKYFPKTKSKEQALEATILSEVEAYKTEAYLYIEESGHQDYRGYLNTLDSTKSLEFQIQQLSRIINDPELAQMLIIEKNTRQFVIQYGL